MAENPLFSTRPYASSLYVPAGYNAAKPTPLLLLLHGYGFNGDAQELFFNLKPVAEAHTFLYAFPTGTQESSGLMKTFWNATDACCNFGGSTVDDSQYLDAMITDIASHYNVDTKRIYLVGHSNGGFMAHRMACDHSSRIAGIVSLAGATWKDDSKCPADSPVAVLEVHGDADGTIKYGGGSTGVGSYPSARKTIESWGTKNGCTGSRTATAAVLDLDTGLPGAETTKEAVFGCPSGAAAELWTIQGGEHLPSLQTDPDLASSWGETVWSWLSEHPKP